MKDGHHKDGGGYECWLSDGRLHREDGPASIFPDGTKSWYNEGILSRFCGPAIEWPNGKTYWIIQGKEIDSEIYKNFLLDNGIDIDNLTEEDKVLLRLIFG